MAAVPKSGIQPRPSLSAAVALLTEAGLPASDLAAAGQRRIHGPATRRLYEKSERLTFSRT